MNRRNFLLSSAIIPVYQILKPKRSEADKVRIENFIKKHVILEPISKFKTKEFQDLILKELEVQYFFFDQGFDFNPRNKNLVDAKRKNGVYLFCSSEGKTLVIWYKQWLVEVKGNDINEKDD